MIHFRRSWNIGAPSDTKTYEADGNQVQAFCAFALLLHAAIMVGIRKMSTTEVSFDLVYKDGIIQRYCFTGSGEEMSHLIFLAWPYSEALPSEDSNQVAESEPQEAWICCSLYRPE